MDRNVDRCPEIIQGKLQVGARTTPKTKTQSGISKMMISLFVQPLEYLRNVGTNLVVSSVNSY